MAEKKCQTGGKIFLGRFEDAPGDYRKSKEISPWFRSERNGFLLAVPPGASAGEPIAIDAGQMPRLLAVIGEGASVRIVSMSPKYPKSPLSITQECRVASKAKVEWRNLTPGGTVSHHLEVFVEGRDARADVAWIFHARGKDRQEITSSVRFLAPGGRGETILKGVAESRASIRSHGKIFVSSKAKGTETFLSDHILLLDRAAKADAVPELVIETNDVKASHSASVSRINSEDLFYFAARGVDEKKAREMYVRGFLGELFKGDPQLQQILKGL